MTTKQPSYPRLLGRKPDMHGCCSDKHDALKLAGFSYVGLMQRRFKTRQYLSGQRLRFSKATLTWLPFTRQGGGLIDPFAGFSLPSQNLR